jgi:hypothetical protein
MFLFCHPRTIPCHPRACGDPGLDSHIRGNERLENDVKYVKLEFCFAEAEVAELPCPSEARASCEGEGGLDASRNMRDGILEFYLTKILK